MTSGFSVRKEDLVTKILRAVVPLVVLFAMVVAARPALADPPDSSPPPGAGADQHSQNMKLLASLPRTGTTNSDIAFWGHTAYQGNYNGFRVIDISEPEQPNVLADVDCGSGQGDVTVWQNILVRSVDYPMTERSCAGERSPDPTKPGQFEGVQIFDVSNPHSPQLVKLVDTDCGSHTNTLIPDPAHGRLLIYVLSYFLLPGPNCGDGREANPLHAKFSIVSVPLTHPQDAAVVATPAIDAEPFELDGLGPTIGCHDVGVFMPLHLAAVACLSEAQLWDISDPLNPRTIAHIQEPDPGFEIWHSATWTWDGKYIVFGDETDSGSCHGDQTEMDGRVWFYRLSDLQSGTTTPVGSFLIPRDQGDEYCSAHMFNVVPIKDRYVLVSSWYGGGTDVIDFTDPTHAREIAYYDVESPNQGSFWAAYWYNGFIYGSDIPNGFDSFLYSGPERAAAQQLGHLNPQTQESYLR
jgi:hypothetical protein